MKLNLIRSFVEGKRVIVLDDSIVRGNTAKSRCRLIKEAGATEVHMLVSCPPHRHPCFYGIDFPSADDLIANHHSNGELARLLGLDSLGYLSEDSMARAIGDCSLCLACFNGKYPTPVPL